MGRFQRASSPAELEARDAARAAKLEALHGTLTEQIAALRTGTDWQRWLTVAARFHNYSFNNVLLIAAQRPGATAVAGYEAWKALGRQVDKGERGIQILAPIVRRASNVMAGDDTTTMVSTAADTTGNNNSGQTTGSGSAPRRVAGFRVAHVFDVDQTSGGPLPERPAPVLLAGQAPPGLWDVLAAQVHARGFAIERGPCLGGAANGVTNYATRTVTVRADVDDAQAVKTLAHELAHVLLHDPTGPATTADPTDPTSAQPTNSAGHCRGRIEVEAESIAFLITSSHGLDSGAYTFPYVAGWAASVDATDPEAVVRATGQRVLTAAHTVLTAIEDLYAPAATTAADLILGQQQTDNAHRALAGRAQRAAEQTAALALTAAHTEQTVRSIGAGAGRPTVRVDRQHPVDAEIQQLLLSGPGGTHAPERLVQVHELATAFYRSRLADAPGDGRRAVELLADRGVDAATAVAEGLGYAPRAWTRLVKALQADGVSDDELLAAGLAIPTARGTLVDRFRDRLIFPVRDGAGRTVALLGRAVDPTATDRSGQPVPKYLNSPDSELYRKGAVLYGLDQAGRAALAAGAVPVLVEGPMDVRAVNLAGTALTAPGGGPHFVGVAPCGTALTDQQVALLDAAVGGLAERGVVVAFDGDAAGRTAAVRAFEPLRAVGAWPHALNLPAGYDPDVLLQQHGPTGVQAALRAAAALPLADLVIDERLDRYADQLQWAEGQIAAGRAAAAVVASLPPDQIGRQIVRLVARLDLPAGEVSDLVVDAVTHPSRYVVTRPPVASPTGAAHPPPPADPRIRPQPGETPVPTALQRARAGFPAPLTLQPPRSAATPPRPAAPAAAAPPVRRHA
jgi:DNA primase